MYTVYVHIAPNNKKYVGITSTLPEVRWGTDGKGYRQQPLFYRAIKKYGWDNITHLIVAEQLTKEQACALEIELIAQYKSNNTDYGYNLSTGGENTSEGSHKSESFKKYMSDKMRGNKSRTGYKNSEHHKQRCSEAMMGNDFGKYRKITDEYRHKAQINQPHRKIIQQYTLDGELVAEYNSINEAHKLSGIWNIGQASMENSGLATAGGFVWKRKGN